MERGCRRGRHPLFIFFVYNRAGWTHKFLSIKHSHFSTMTTVVEHQFQCPGTVQIVADYSPPRGTDPTLLEVARNLDADFISVNYSPGKSARVNSAFAAAWIKQNADKEVIFSLSTRDMNRVAVQGLLLGANMMGLENVVVLKGDSFTESELGITKSVDDYMPTGLIRAIADMNRGIDYKGLKLQDPSSFCIGATIDLARSMDRQVALTRKKVEAGAQFFLLQALFSPERLTEFRKRYADRYGEELSALICCGVQVSGGRRGNLRRATGLGDFIDPQGAFGRRHRRRDGEQVPRCRTKVNLPACPDLPGRAT